MTTSTRTTARTHRFALCLALLLSFALPAFAQQDTWSGVERIVAVGDVHGDYEQFVKTLRAAEVMDKDNKWTAGKTHLVQTGDVFGRGPNSKKVLDLLLDLEAQAAKAGGMVHALLGNHELMVLQGSYHYLDPRDVEAFGGQAELTKALAADGKYGKWLRGHNAIVQINDTIFCHAGLTPRVSHMKLSEINKAVVADLVKSESGSLVLESDGPLWTRVYADDDSAAERIDAVLKARGAGRMVVGHNVMSAGVTPLAGGKVIGIDVGMTGLIGGPAACLVIDKGVLYEVGHERPKRRLNVPAASAPATVPAKA